MTSGNDVRVLEPTRTTVSGKTRANETTLHGALFLLTMSTGAVDAVSYLGMGHVFTANMTGNVVFLGFALAGVSGVSVARSVSSLVAFFWEQYSEANCPDAWLKMRRAGPVWPS